MKNEGKAGIFSSFPVCEGRSPLAASTLAKPPVGINIPRETWVKNYEAVTLSSYNYFIYESAETAVSKPGSGGDQHPGCLQAVHRASSIAPEQESVR